MIPIRKHRWAAARRDHHSLPVNDKLLLAVLERGLDDPVISVGPVVAVPGDQAHPVAVALKAQAVAVVFYFVEPIRAGGDARRSGREAKIKSLKHAFMPAGALLFQL